MLRSRIVIRATLLLSLQQLQCSNGVSLLSLIPSNNITLFVGKDAAIFTCIANGSNVQWLIDGQGTNNPAIQQRGVKSSTSQINGSLIHSTLTIAKNATNNGTIINCLAIDYSFTVSLSKPVKLTLQGTLNAPSNFNVSLFSGNSFQLTWGSPFSLNVSGSVAIFYYTVCANFTVAVECRNITTDCDFKGRCNQTTNFTDVTTPMGTLSSMKTAILFTMFAVNGAGVGNVSRYEFDTNSAADFWLTPSSTYSPSSDFVSVGHAITTNVKHWLLTNASVTPRSQISHSYSVQTQAATAAAIMVPLLTIHLMTTLLCVMKNSMYKSKKLSCDTENRISVAIECVNTYPSRVGHTTNSVATSASGPT